MQAITVRDRDAGIGGLSLTDLPYPHTAENDVIVQVHAAGFTPGELDWPATWTDRSSRASGPYGRSRRHPPRSPPPGAPREDDHPSQVRPLREPATPRLIDRGDLLAALDRAAARKVTIILGTRESPGSDEALSPAWRQAW